MNLNISNLASIVFSVNKNVAPQKTAGNSEFKAPTPTNTQSDNLTPRQFAVLSQQVTTAATNIMNNIQQNIFLKDMLGLPKEWTNLLNEFAFSANNAQLAAMLKGLQSANAPVNSSLLALLNSSARVNLAALAQQLSQNSSLMADKMLKLMGNAMNQQNIAQLKDIMLIGASIANNAQVNPQEFIRDIIQMYLPWLPLVPPQDKDLTEIETKAGGQGNENSQLLFYLSTSTLGYFKVEVLLGDENEVYITNIVEKFNNELKELLCNKLKESFKTTSINAKLFLSQKVDNEEINLKEKQIYIVNADDSLAGLTLLHSISRTIFEFDEKEGQRAQRLEETLD
ncbi:hypothetical protein IKA92_02360 [bacterium]|nr:hypothetical protein [bacterium]